MTSKTTFHKVIFFIGLMIFDVGLVGTFGKDTLLMAWGLVVMAFVIMDPTQ